MVNEDVEGHSKYSEQSCWDVRRERQRPSTELSTSHYRCGSKVSTLTRRQAVDTDYSVVMSAVREIESMI
jgi:hypothetical protein